jgi:hypothetical protein
LHAWKHWVRNPGGPASGLANKRQVRTVNLRGTTVMHGCRESDSPIVPQKPANKGRLKGTAEQGEGRGLAEGNVVERTRSRTQRRGLLSQAPDRVRQATRRF